MQTINCLNKSQSKGERILIRLLRTMRTLLFEFCVYANFLAAAIKFGISIDAHLIPFLNVKQ